MKQYWIVLKQGVLTTLFRSHSSINPNTPELPELPGLAVKCKKLAKVPNILYAHCPHATLNEEILADGRWHIIAKQRHLSAQEVNKEPPMEDTATLSCTDQADNFSYLLGKDFGDLVDTSSSTDNVGSDNVICINVRKHYPSLVRTC